MIICTDLLFKDTFEVPVKSKEQLEALRKKDAEKNYTLTGFRELLSKQISQSTQPQSTQPQENIIQLRNTYKSEIQNDMKIRERGYLRSEAFVDYTNYKSQCMRGLYLEFNDTVLQKPIDTSEAVDISLMFFRCKHLKRIHFLDKMIVDNVTCFSSIFQGCCALDNYSGIELWNMKNCESLTNAFSYSGIKSLKEVINWKFTKTVNCGEMFICSKIESLEGLNQFDFSHVISTYRMFAYCNITSLKGTENLDLSNVKHASMMFAYTPIKLDTNITDTWKLPEGYNIIDLFYPSKQD